MVFGTLSERLANALSFQRNRTGSSAIHQTIGPKKLTQNFFSGEKVQQTLAL